MEKIEGFTTVMGGSLVIKIEGKEWALTIRRADDSTYGPFYEFHQKEMTKDDIKKFIPNFANLSWKNFKVDLFGVNEEIATDGDFKVGISYSQKSGLQSQDVIEDFINFLA